ncbi:PF05107 family [Leptospira interrogans serovar Canicola]|nr:PF05107 family [Leptospira interrogans serovar Canicola]
MTIVKSATPPNDIYIKEKAVLIETHEKAYVAVGAKLETSKKEEKEKKNRRRPSWQSERMDV